MGVVPALGEGVERGVRRSEGVGRGGDGNGAVEDTEGLKVRKGDGRGGRFVWEAAVTLREGVSGGLGRWRKDMVVGRRVGCLTGMSS
jgi:hypothetical protein